MRGIQLNWFRLSKQEWEVLSQLHPLLDIFLQATMKISQTKTPLVHKVIPIFDIITHILGEYIDDASKLPAVHATTRRGLALLNKYYGLTDDSVMYCVAMRKLFFC